MTGACARVALKIDVDTYRGTHEGVPAMLEDLAAAGVRATFFFTVGPDHSGRAIVRAVTRRGFVRKMVRTNAVRMYGWKTAFYGTLLPAPDIGRRCAAILRRCRDAGHDVGLHAWDHVAWQDRVPGLDRAAIGAVLDRAESAFAEIFGAPPRAFAAPGWLCTGEAFAAIERRGFDYVSVSRGRVGPFRPTVAGRTLALLEIPTTLPTLDEELGRDGVTASNYVTRLVSRYRPGATEVLTVHAESEGLAYRSLFLDLLDRHRQLGVRDVTLRELAADAGASAQPRGVHLGLIPGRAGEVTLADA
jgi:peptidoglycan/xylan/chitin deacetylase (PgdA/CDA1 family)